MTAPSSHRARLAARLRAVRAARFPSGNQFAKHIGWQQSRVSKLETGTQLPTDDDIRDWVAAAGADPDTEAELLDMLAGTRVVYATWRDTFRRTGAADNQTKIAALEAQSTRIGNYRPGMMLGLLQTAAYARALLSLPGGPMDAGGATEAELDALIVERIRRQEVLYEPGKQIQLVMGEEALYRVPGDAGTTLGQLDRLISVTGLPSVELAIVPLRAVPIMPLGGFALFDDELVVAESLSGEQRLTEPVEVAVYLKAFEALRDAALTGRAAVELIQRVAAGLRDQLSPPARPPSS
ncbi:MAG: helix-turn-helix domain-containing protein [Pseudonocardiaceae bacterium]